MEDTFTTRFKVVETTTTRKITLHPPHLCYLSSVEHEPMIETMKWTVLKLHSLFFCISLKKMRTLLVLSLFVVAYHHLGMKNRFGSRSTSTAILQQMAGKIERKNVHTWELIWNSNVVLRGIETMISRIYAIAPRAETETECFSRFFHTPIVGLPSRHVN